MDSSGEKERNATTNSNKGSVSTAKKPTSDKIRPSKAGLKKPKIGRTVQAIASRYSRSIKRATIKKPKPKSKSKPNKDQPVRVRNSKITPYAFFVKSFFKEYRRRNPEEKIDFIALSRQCAKQWHELSEEMRDEFQKMAKRANTRLSRVHKIIDDVKPIKCPSSTKRAAVCAPSTSKTVRMMEPKRESKASGKIVRESIRSHKRSMDKGTITVKTKTNTKKINTLKYRESGKTLKELTKKKGKRSGS